MSIGARSRILITGATGLIGAHLGSALREDGHEIVALSRDSARAREKLPWLADAFAPGAEDGALPAESLAGVHAVVNLAGEPVAGRWTEAKKQAIRASRIAGTRRVVDAIAVRPVGARPSVLVSASAMGYYGETGDRAVSESDPPGDGFLARLCVEWEREAMRAEEFGVRVVLLRIALVLARRGGALEPMLLPFRLGLGGRLASGRQYWSWIHIADVVGLVRHALARSELRGPLNVAAPAAVPQAEFARALARVLRRPAFVPVPGFAIRAVWGEFATELVTSRRLVPARALETGYRFEFPELEPALRDLIG
jgi:uncharacterized protein (TIGR01777 family)